MVCLHIPIDASVDGDTEDDDVQLLDEPAEVEEAGV